MNGGWIRFNLPRTLSHTEHWQIQVRQFEGNPCELIAVPAGSHQVIICANIDFENTKLRFQLVVEVFVSHSNITDIYLPLPESTIQELLRFLQS